MMTVTHCAIAAASTSLILSTADPVTLSLACLGGLLPDLDTSTSILGQILFPVSRWIEARYPHRSITHSLLASGAIAFVCSGISLLLGDWRIMAVPIGHLSACFADCFTVQGVQLFWPNPAWAISVSNPRRRLKTGGPGEYWVLAIAVGLLTVGIFLANAGGLSTQTGQLLGLRDQAIADYQKGNQWAEVDAQDSDRKPIKGIFPILAREGNEFVLLAPDPVNTKELFVKSLKLVNRPGRVTRETVSFEDQPFGVTRGYLLGELDIDLPEDLPEQAPPQLSLSGKTVKFSYTATDEAIAYLKNQYVTGQVEVLRFVEN